MILGRKLRNLLNTPAMRLKAEADKCIDCQRCTAACPMSLDVNKMARAEALGSVHYFETPGGVAGVVLAGFLGCLLAKSIYETRGIFWTWLIHCLPEARWQEERQR